MFHHQNRAPCRNLFNQVGNHVHVFVSAKPSVSPSEVVRILKGASSQAVRKAHPALRDGELTLLSQDQVLAFRRHDAKENLLVVINYGTGNGQVDLALGYSQQQLTPMSGFGSQAETTDPQGNLTLDLAPREVRIYRL